MKDTGKDLLAFLLGGVLSLGLAVSAHADKLDDARAKESKAYNDYYKALRHAPAPVTPQEAADLSRKMIDPATIEVGKAAIEQAADAVKKKFSALPKGSAIAVGKGGAIKKVDLQRPAETPRREIPAIIETTPSGPETVIDGSNVPREIEFPGVQKKPSPAPSKK